MANALGKRASGSVRPKRASRHTSGDAMSIQFLLVTYPEQRAVLADGAGIGFTNHMLMLPGDEYLLTLDGDGYQPLSQDIALTGTSMVKPMVISFVPTSTVAGKAVPSPTTPEDAARRGGKKNA